MSVPPPSEKQARIIWASLTILAVAVALSVIGLVLYGVASVLGLLSSILMPIAIAGIMAALLDPLVVYFERHAVPRFRAILLVYVITIAMILGLLGTVVPAAYVQATQLIDEVVGWGRTQAAKVKDSAATRPQSDAAGNPAPPAREVLTSAPDSPTNSVSAPPAEPPAPEGLAAWLSKDGLRRKLQELWSDENIDRLKQKSKELLPAAGNWVLQKFIAATHLLGWAIGIVLIPVYIFYFLKEKSGIEKNWRTYLPIHHDSSFRQDVIFIVQSINDAMIVFFRGQILVGIISGVLLAVGLSLQGVRYSLLIGVLAAVLGVVPYLGFIFSMIVALIVSAVQFGNATQPAITFAICLIVHLAEGFGYQPKIIGDRVGLHPMTIIIALFLGATLLGGLLGGLLAIPIAALIRTLMYRYVWVKQEAEVQRLDQQPAAGG